MKIVTGCAVGLALMGAACASKSPSAAGSTTAVSPTTTASGGGRGYGYGGGATGVGTGSGGTAVATVKQGPNGQFVFSPSKLTLTKGQTIAVKDVGSVAHTFTIQGKGIDVVNQPGQSQNVKIDLAPGTYTFICNFHVNLGMQGTLTVTG
jgi:plastocyanin